MRAQQELDRISREIEAKLKRRAVMYTNFAIKTLNEYLRNPVRKLGSNPSASQIAQIYHTIMGLLPSPTEKCDAFYRDEDRKRMTNLVCRYFTEESVKLGKYFVATRQASSLADAGRKLFNQPVGSVADALGFEMRRRLMKVLQE